MRPIERQQKETSEIDEALAWHDGDALATIATLIETAKLNDVEPLAYLADVITKIVNGHPNSQLDDLLPWAFADQPETKTVA